MTYFIRFLLGRENHGVVGPVSGPTLTLCTTLQVRNVIVFSIPFCHNKLCAVTNIGNTTWNKP